MNDLASSLSESLTNLVVTLVGYLPSLVGGILLLLLGWLISRLIASAVRRLAERFRLEKLLARGGLLGGLQQAGIQRTPADLVATLIFWIIFLNFLLMALETLGLTAAVEPLRSFIAFLPDVLVAIITLIAGSLVAEFIGKAIQGAMAGMGVEFHEALGRVVRVLLMVVVIIIVLQQLNIDVTLLNDTFITLLTLAFAGIALAFGLGGRRLAREVLAGYYARETFRTGDRVLVDEFDGTVESIGTLNTAIQGADELLVIPNTRLTEGQVRVLPPADKG